MVQNSPMSTGQAFLFMYKEVSIERTEKRLENGETTTEIQEIQRPVKGKRDPLTSANKMYQALKSKNQPACS